MPDDILWRHEVELRELGIRVPAWIEKDIDTRQLGAILQGGCASGAYMPAVEYTAAAKTMGEHGDEVFRYIEDMTGDPMEAMPAKPPHWSAICCAVMSWAVEQWAGEVVDDVVRRLHARDADAESASLEELEAAEEILRRAEEES